MAPNGFKGMMLAREVRPDLILLDLYMPKMDGYCMMEHLNEDPVTHGIPVIVVSAWPTGDQVERALQGGARAFVSKPYDNDKLVNLIKDNLAEPVEPQFVVLDVHSAEV
jgi:CheY-like chemotaxis protein